MIDKILGRDGKLIIVELPDEATHILENKYADKSLLAVRVHVTYDYGAFKDMVGNRKLDHIANIEKQIKTMGLLPQPITVNEKLEIIDGQHRFQACKNLGLPILYIVRPGADINDCIGMNVGQKTWKYRNYSECWDARGNENYKRLNELITKWSLVYTEEIIKKVIGCGFTITESYAKGELELTEADYDRANKALEYIKDFAGYIGGRFTKAYTPLAMALNFCFLNENIDNARLLSSYGRAKNQNSKIVLQADFMTMKSCLEFLDAIYDYKRVPSHVVVKEYLECDTKKGTRQWFERAKKEWRKNYGKENG